MPYFKDNCSLNPSLAAKSEAKIYTIKYWSRIQEHSITNIKGYLAMESRPVVIGMYIYNDFRTLKETNPIYNNTHNTKPKDVGYHALVIIGYDDTKNAFKFINSWGDDWGIDGFGWIDYEFCT